jgi:hypothetical protein
MPPTAEPLMQNILDETFVLMLSPTRRNDRRCGSTSAPGRVTAGARAFRLVRGGFAKREHRPLIRIGSL